MRRNYGLRVKKNKKSEGTGARTGEGASSSKTLKNEREDAQEGFYQKRHKKTTISHPRWQNIDPQKTKLGKNK